MTVLIAIVMMMAISESKSQGAGEKPANPRLNAHSPTAVHTGQATFISPSGRYAHVPASEADSTKPTKPVRSERLSNGYTITK